MKYPVLIAGRGSPGLACRNTQEPEFKRYNGPGRHARLRLQARSLPWLSISVKQRCVASTAGTGTHRDWRHPGRRKRRYIMGRWNVGIFYTAYKSKTRGNDGLGHGCWWHYNGGLERAGFLPGGFLRVACISLFRQDYFSANDKQNT